MIGGGEARDQVESYSHSYLDRAGEPPPPLPLGELAGAGSNWVG
jgi:hypothetical protein